MFISRIFKVRLKAINVLRRTARAMSDYHLVEANLKVKTILWEGKRDGEGIRRGVEWIIGR